MLKSPFLCGVTCLAKASCYLYLFPSESDDIETTMDNKLQSKVNCTFNGVEIFPIKKKKEWRSLQNAEVFMVVNR